MSSIIEKIIDLITDPFNIATANLDVNFVEMLGDILILACYIYLFQTFTTFLTSILSSIFNFDGSGYAANTNGGAFESSLTNSMADSFGTDEIEKSLPKDSKLKAFSMRKGIGHNLLGAAKAAPDTAREAVTGMDKKTHDELEKKKKELRRKGFNSKSHWFNKTEDAKDLAEVDKLTEGLMKNNKRSEVNTTDNKFNENTRQLAFNQLKIGRLLESKENLWDEKEISKINKQIDEFKKANASLAEENKKLLTGALKKNLLYASDDELKKNNDLALKHGVISRSLFDNKNLLDSGELEKLRASLLADESIYDEIDMGNSYGIEASLNAFNAALEGTDSMQNFIKNRIKFRKANKNLRNFNEGFARNKKLMYNKDQMRRMVNKKLIKKSNSSFGNGKIGKMLDKDAKNLNIQARNELIRLEQEKRILKSNLKEISDKEQERIINDRIAEIDKVLSKENIQWQNEINDNKDDINFLLDNLTKEDLDNLKKAGDITEEDIQKLDDIGSIDGLAPGVEEIGKSFENIGTTDAPTGNVELPGSEQQTNLNQEPTAEEQQLKQQNEVMKKVTDIEIKILDYKIGQTKNSGKDISLLEEKKNRIEKKNKIYTKNIEKYENKN